MSKLPPLHLPVSKVTLKKAKFTFFPWLYPFKLKLSTKKASNELDSTHSAHKVTSFLKFRHVPSSAVRKKRKKRNSIISEKSLSHFGCFRRNCKQSTRGADSFLGTFPFAGVLLLTFRCHAVKADIIPRLLRRRRRARLPRMKAKDFPRLEPPPHATPCVRWVTRLISPSRWPVYVHLGSYCYIETFPGLSTPVAPLRFYRSALIVRILARPSFMNFLALLQLIPTHPRPERVVI